MIFQTKNAGVPSKCPSSPRPGDKVVVDFPKKTDSLPVNMYFTRYPFLEELIHSSHFMVLFTITTAGHLET